MNDWSIPSSILSPDPVDDNPFLPSDPRHEVWQKATRRAEEEFHRLSEGLLDLRWETSAGFQAMIVGAVSAQFDIWANRSLHVIRDDDSVKAFGKWLVTYANSYIEKYVKRWTCPPDVQREDLLTELRTALMGRVEHWQAEARDHVSGIEGALSKITPTAPSGKPPSPTRADFEDLKEHRRVLVKQALRRKGFKRSEFLRTNNITPDTLRGVINGDRRRVNLADWTPTILSLLDIAEDDWNTA